MNISVELSSTKKAENCSIEERVKIGDTVIIKEDYGYESGVVQKLLSEDVVCGNTAKKASVHDMENIAESKEKCKQMKPKIQRMAREAGLNVKITRIHINVDNTKLLIIFVSEERVDFRNFLKLLVKEYRYKIELRQIGVREETKIKGGIGICGKECCCSSNLNCFHKVSIKMAKNQGLSLNPSKISGLCGKLLCCLEYENETYLDLTKNMPRINSFVDTPNGSGMVVYNDILNQIVHVKVAKNDGVDEVVEYKVEEVKFKKNEQIQN